MSWPEATALCVFMVCFSACFIASMYAPPISDDPFWDEEEDEDEDTERHEFVHPRFSQRGVDVEQHGRRVVEDD